VISESLFLSIFSPSRYPPCFSGSGINLKVAAKSTHSVNRPDSEGEVIELLNNINLILL